MLSYLYQYLKLFHHLIQQFCDDIIQRVVHFENQTLGHP